MGAGQSASYAHRMRVLVVDDSLEVRARLVAMLTEVTAVKIIDEAGDGDGALALIAERAPDVVLLDIHMPGKSGLIVLGTIKAGAAVPPVIVVLTNDPTEHHRRECLAHGADYFFDKSKHFDRAIAVLAALALEREGGRPTD
jgi:two-component system response regulator DevR